MVYLRPMTDDMFHEFYRGYSNDPDLYFDKSDYAEYVYSEERVKKYIARIREKKRIPLAVMEDDDIAGEILFKDIEPGVCATLSIVLKNDRYKNRGIGTAAEKLAARYAFDELGVHTLYADAVLTNTRSMHVLEKAGFAKLREEGIFAYYSMDDPG